MKRARGFTLIELMVVVAIIAILASLAITAYSKAVGKSQLSEAFTATQSLKGDVLAYRAQTGACPSIGMAGTGLASNAASYSGKYVAKADVATDGDTCVITAYLRNNTVSSELRGKQVVFTLNSATDGAVTWSCSSDAASEYVPQSCR